MKRKIYLILTIVIFALIGIFGYFNFSQPQAEEEFTGDFGSENNHYRNTETKNLSPYAIFGDSSFVLMTEAERTGKQYLRIPNTDKNSEVKDLVFELKTGKVSFLDKKGKTLYHIILKPTDLAKFLSVDPAANEYPSLSPYAYVANNPINAIDPDGRRILFVNGYYQDNWAGRNVFGSDKALLPYWQYSSERGTSNSMFVSNAQSFFNDNYGNQFIDGSGSWSSSASNRHDAGYEYAKANFKTITADMVEGETIKMVTHSQGGAYGAGIAKYLIEQGIAVETVVHLSPHQTQDFETPKEPMTYQMGYEYDPVSLGSGELISGVDKMGTVNRGDLNILQKHGSTRVGQKVWGHLQDLQSAYWMSSPGLNIAPQGSDNTRMYIPPSISIQGSQNGTNFSDIYPRPSGN